MQCPVCKTKDLVMSERQGIEIDYCPQCRGVWLDRGELDKIIDRSQDDVAPAAAPQPQPQPQPQQHQYQQHRPAPPPPGGDYAHGYGEPYHGYYKKKKRKGLLSEIFDF